MKRNLTRINNVIAGSIAEESGITQGDFLLSINGEKIKDIFDYRFLETNEYLLLEVQKVDGEIWEIEIDKDEYEELGIEFEESMMDEAKSCTNNCVFCFIDQLPKGMRDTLYFKDDDSRLSFLMGNYVTLTNMRESDIDRIIKYKMSPINVSVHTTNPDLRVFMLKNRFAGTVMQTIERLTAGGITVNCQIVLCRDLNDGVELDNSISDLSNLYPGVHSISVVPVGITRHRKGLAELKPYTSDSSASVVRQVEAWQKKLAESKGSQIVYLADEFYIMAGIEIPTYEHYEDFPQIENGVGMVAMLKSEIEDYLSELDSYLQADTRKVSIATGVSVANFIKEIAELIEKRYNGIKIQVFDIKNRFFGEDVTVTGLLTGRDIVSQLTGEDLGDELLICRTMLKKDEEVLLDDYTVDMLRHELNVKISVVENTGQDFVDKVLGKDI